jgi:pimeloyl-ACP methyl ester carboxylesterase
MAGSTPQTLEIGSGATRRRIAFLKQGGRTPGVVWLGGFRSEMTATKATALAAWAEAGERACLRFDYSGHGQSEGRFEDGTISRWLEEASAVFTQLTSGQQILIGSSMGGYIALLLLRALQARAPAEAARIQGLMLIAPAWDMTEALMWKEFPESVRRTVLTDGVFMRPSQYGDPYPITRALIEDGRRHLIGGNAWDPGCPIHVMHGLQDPDVPWEHTLELESFLTGNRVRVEAVPDGEHRLSRPEDIALMLRMIEGLLSGSARR